MWARRTLAVLFLFLLADLGRPFSSYAAEPMRLVDLQLGLSFPPLTDDAQRAFTRLHLEPLHISHARMAEHWFFREPQKGQFQWGPLDARIGFLKDNGLSVLLTIQSFGPEWAITAPRNERSAVFANDEDFDEYVTALLLRYPGKIDKIQFGNEWQSAWWYAGTAQDFVRFHNILSQAARRHSPQTKVVLGGFSPWSLERMAASKGLIDYVYDDQWRRITGQELEDLKDSASMQEMLARIAHVLANADYDILDLHLYDDVENWPIYIDMMRQAAPGKPIVVSEFGGPNMMVEGYTEEYQAARLVQYIATLDEAGVPEAYYFKLMAGGDVNPVHRMSGLFTEGGEKLRAYDAFVGFLPKGWGVSPWRPRRFRARLAAAK
jgi:hypothetical protein